MKILITGATGFIGRSLFLGGGHKNHEIAIFVRRSDCTDKYRELIPHNVQVVDLDYVTKDETGFQPDLLIHAATAYGRIDDVEAVISANITLPMVLLERFTQNLKGVVYLDTYYNKVDYHYPWLLDYSISKNFFHKWILEKYKAIPKARIFLEHVYGPNDRPDKFIPDAIRTLKMGEKLVIGDGQPVRDFTFVGDVAEGIWKVADWFQNDPKLGPSQLHTFEFGTGNGVSVANMASLLTSLAGRPKSDLKVGALPPRKGEIMRSIANLETLSPLGWQPSTTLERGLKITVDSVGLR